MSLIPVIAGAAARRRGGAAFDPESISDCLLWLDASDANNMRTSAPAVPGNGDSVEEWRASGTTSVDGDGTGAFTRPVYRTAVINGRSALEFDSAVLLLSSPWVTGGVWTLFVASKANVLSAATRFQYAGRNSGSGTSARMYMYQTNAAHIMGASSNGALASVSASSDTAWRVVTHVRSSTDGQAFVSGVGDNTGANTTLESPGIAVLGAFPTSTGGSMSNYWEGYIGEVIGYNRALTSGERTSVVNYLTAKWT